MTLLAESLAAFVFEFRHWTPTTSQKSTATNQVNQPDPPLKMKSSVDLSASKEFSEQAAPRLMGLGIMTKKFKNTYKANMTRVTEVTENGSYVVSMNPLTKIDSDE